MSMFDGGIRSAQARALTTVHLISVSFDDVREVLVDRPDVLWAVVRILARRLRATDEALADAMFLDVTGRTAKRLLALAGSDDEFRMPLTQEELAGMVGASRERVNKAIAMFVKLGWLEISGRSQYHILDRAELEARAIS
jgi:CRP-like cAMP-binding protein